MTDHKTGKPVPVAPRVPFLPELLPATGTPRARLARWVTDPANPNFPRATVNRVWALMFGRPLVAPVDDLTGAEAPPPALQLLADDFVAHGYDLKRLIRVIATTHVFQLDSATEPEPTEAHEAAWAVFPLTKLRPEQVVGAVSQAASLETINDDSHILVKLISSIDERNFVHRYGDTGEDAFDSEAGTIPQRLLLMNGTIVNNKTKPGLFNAAQRIATPGPQRPRGGRACLPDDPHPPPDRRGVRPLRGEARRHQERHPEPAGERPLLDADQRDGVLVESLSLATRLPTTELSR